MVKVKEVLILIILTSMLVVLCCEISSTGMLLWTAIDTPPLGLFALDCEPSFLCML